jgi:hypothetical protein
MIEMGDQPQPETEPGEPNPGGVDAVAGNDHEVAPVVPDLSTEDNPAVEDAAPDELTQQLAEPEETEDGASTDGASEPEQEAQA